MDDHKTEEKKTTVNGVVLPERLAALAALKLSNGKPQGRGPGGPGGWHRQVEQAHDSKATFKRLLGFLRGRLSLMIAVAVLVLLGTLLGLAGPWLLGQAVDSLKLLREIQKQAERVGRTIKVLLELHIAEEATKYGLTLDACRQLLSDGEWRQMSHVQICGLMMMASNVDDEAQICQEFDTAARFFDEVKRDFFADAPYFCERSWGMSQDYHLAVQHGSTMVRVGTTIFGPRIY